LLQTLSHLTNVTDADGSLFTDTAALTYIPSTKSLGINTFFPNANLDVLGDAIISGSLDVSSIIASTANLSGITSVISIDNTTKTTFENALGINSLSQLRVTGFTTLSNFSSSGYANLHKLKCKWDNDS